MTPKRVIASSYMRDKVAKIRDLAYVVGILLWLQSAYMMSSIERDLPTIQTLWRIWAEVDLGVHESAEFLAEFGVTRRKRMFILWSHRSSHPVRWLVLCLFVALAAGSVQLETGDVHAMGKTSRVRIARLALSKDNPRPASMRRLLWELDKRTSLKPILTPVEVTINDPQLFLYPLIYVSGSKAFPKLSAQDVVRLRTYLVSGGTLFFDMAEGNPKGPFDTSVRRLSKRLFPQQPMQKLKQKHTLFKSFYLIRRFGGRVLQAPYIEGVTQDDRTMIIYSMNDLNGAWERDNFGNWTHPVVPGGSSQREHSFRLGINIAMYALCVNYKADMVHIPFIMRRRK